MKNQTKERAEGALLSERSRPVEKQACGEADTGSFSPLCFDYFWIFMRDTGEVESGPFPCVTPGSAVQMTSQAPGVGQGMRTMQGPKGRFIFTRKGREDSTHRERILAKQRGK